MRRRTSLHTANEQALEQHPFRRVAKLDQMEAATVLKDLRIPPGNRMEALSGNRKSQHSIRINGQRRICFIWGQNGPENVEIIGYH